MTSPPPSPSPVVHQRLGWLPRRPPRAEMLRYLGYQPGRSPTPALSAMIEEVLEQGWPSLEPSGTYAIYPVGEGTSEVLRLGEVMIVGEVRRFVEPASRVAAFLVTAGGEISRLVEAAWREGDPLRGWVLDALGSWAAESVADALMTALANHLGPEEALTLRYSPGYCGMDLQEQSSLFALVDAEAVGVRLLPSMLMDPMKSISGLVGLIPASAKRATRSPCADCTRQRCPMRR